MECGNLNSGCLSSICLRQYFWNRQNFQLPDYKEILGKLMFFIFRLRLWLVMSYVKKDQLFQIVFLEKQCYARARPLLRRSFSLEKLRKSSGENERRGRERGEHQQKKQRGSGMKSGGKHFRGFAAIYYRIRILNSILQLSRLSRQPPDYRTCSTQSQNASKVAKIEFELFEDFYRLSRQVAIIEWVRGNHEVY